MGFFDLGCARDRGGKISSLLDKPDCRGQRHQQQGRAGHRRRAERKSGKEGLPRVALLLGSDPGPQAHLKICRRSYWFKTPHQFA